MEPFFWFDLFWMIALGTAVCGMQNISSKLNYPNTILDTIFIRFFTMLLIVTPKNAMLVALHRFKTGDAAVQILLELEGTYKHISRAKGTQDRRKMRPFRALQTRHGRMRLIQSNPSGRLLVQQPSYQMSSSC